MFALSFFFLLAFISVGRCTTDNTRVDCLSHEVLRGSSLARIDDRYRLDIGFRTKDEPKLYFKNASNTTLFTVSFGSCNSNLIGKCWTLIQYKDGRVDERHENQYSNNLFYENFIRTIYVSWEHKDIDIGTENPTLKKPKLNVDRPVFLEIVCSSKTLIVKENECSQRGANVYNWRLIFHQHKNHKMDPVTDNPLDNYFRNLTNMEEFNLFNTRPFEFVLKWDNLPKWQMWSQLSDPTIRDPVSDYTDPGNYPKEFDGLGYDDLQKDGKILKNSDEVFLYVRVFPLCEFARNDYWNNIHANCEANGKYESEPCKVCGAGEYEEKTCGKTENTVCKTCKKCSLGSEYALSPCTSTSDAVCIECSEICEENQYIKQNCTQENDIICETCTTCDSDQYIKEKCTGTKDALCAKCNPCPSNFYPSGGCNGTHDTLCTSCGPLCSEGFYELQECNATHPRICDVCSPECSEGFYELQECNATHPRICDVCSPECSEGFYELQECNATHPRICSQCTDCEHPMSFISTNCSKHSDTVCSSLRNNFSRSKKKQQAPYNFILTIIIFSGILGLLCIVLVVGYVYRQRSKRVHDENEIYADPKSYVMTENSCHKAPISLQEKESNYSDSVDEIQYDSWNDTNIFGLYTSLNAQNPERLTENGFAGASQNISKDLVYEVQGSEYSALSINVDVPEKQQYLSLNTDFTVSDEYSALGIYTASNEESAASGDYTVVKACSVGEEGEYSALKEEYVASNTYSALNAKSDQELYSTLDETEYPKVYYSSSKVDTNYANLSIVEDDSTWYSDVSKERVIYASIKNET